MYLLLIIFVSDIKANPANMLLIAKKNPLLLEEALPKQRRVESWYSGNELFKDMVHSLLLLNTVSPVLIIINRIWIPWVMHPSHQKENLKLYVNLLLGCD